VKCLKHNIEAMPPQNPKKTRGKGGKKERKQRHERKKYNIAARLEVQLKEEIFDSKRRLRKATERFSTCCDASMADGLVRHMLKVTALTNSHICSLNKDKFGYLEFLGEFESHVAIERNEIYDGFVTMDRAGNLKIQHQDFLISYAKNAENIDFHIENSPKRYEEIGWWDIPKKNMPMNLLSFEWNYMLEKCEGLRASEKPCLSEPLEKTLHHD